MPQLPEELVQALVRDYRPLKVVLFGSHVWGRPDEDSDLDLFVIKATDQPFFRRLAAVRKIISPYRKRLPVDIIVFTPEELADRLRAADPFITRIMEEGTVLYEQRK